MRGAILYGSRDVRFEERETPKIMKPTDAIVRISATYVCGSDLWPYRGIQPIAQPTPMGHEYCGNVEEVGSAVTSIKRGQFVVGSFFPSDNTCPNCRFGYQSSCQHAGVCRNRPGATAASSGRGRHPRGHSRYSLGRDGAESIVALRRDGHWMVCRECGERETRLDGRDCWRRAVGLLGVLSAKQLEAERIIAMSRHESRQTLARDFGATDIVTERGEDGVARIKDLTNGLGADSVLSVSVRRNQ